MKSTTKKKLQKELEDEISWALSHQKKIKGAVLKAPRKYELLLEKQQEKLLNSGVGKGIFELSRSCKDQVLFDLSEIKVAKGNLPAMPVITKNLKSIPDLMELLSGYNIEGMSDLNPLLIEDIGSSRGKYNNLFYYVYNVNLGKNLNRRSPLRAEEWVEFSGREPLNVEEAIVLCLHTSILDRYHVVALGSVYGRVGTLSEVPVIKKIEDKIILTSIKRTYDGNRCTYPSKER
ncbi:MAG: hypothetical protein WD471_00300 [Candidatus Paceibacterota bacterium]